MEVKPYFDDLAIGIVLLCFVTKEGVLKTETKRIGR